MNNSITLPPRQQISFPTVAYVRKGKPKIKVTRPDGTSYEALAKNSDLKNKFRIHFLPGTAAMKAVYNMRHEKELVQYPSPSTIPDGYEVQEIHAIIPSLNVLSCWRFGNTANNAGREIARADNERYWTKRDPLNGKYLVKNGEPYTPFVVGEVISYDKNNKHYEIPIKSNGQLRIVCRDMTDQGQAVEFVLKTTSFYDCQQMQTQLAGIQSLADAVSGGNAAGVPIRIFRMEQEILWNHSDGTASRPKSWLINIQPDPEWVKSTFTRMGKMALGDYIPNTPQLVSGRVDPTKDSEDLELEVGDGEVLQSGEVEDGELVEDEAEVLAAQNMTTKKGSRLGDLTAEQLQLIVNSKEAQELKDAALICLANL